MKSFNLEAAKAGKPVCTRVGRKVRIFCFDLKNRIYKIAAAVEIEGGGEILKSYTNDGFFDKDSTSCDDLMMVSEKKRGWIAVLRAVSPTRLIGTSSIYDTKEEVKNAIKNAGFEDKLIDIIQIEWEE